MVRVEAGPGWRKAPSWDDAPLPAAAGPVATDPSCLGDEAGTGGIRPQITLMLLSDFEADEGVHAQPPSTAVVAGDVDSGVRARRRHGTAGGSPHGSFVVAMISTLPTGPDGVHDVHPTEYDILLPRHASGPRLERPTRDTWGLIERLQLLGEARVHYAVRQVWFRVVVGRRCHQRAGQGLRCSLFCRTVFHFW